MSREKAQGTESRRERRGEADTEKKIEARNMQAEKRDAVERNGGRWRGRAGQSTREGQAQRHRSGDTEEGKRMGGGSQ